MEILRGQIPEEVVREAEDFIRSVDPIAFAWPTYDHYPNQHSSILRLAEYLPDFAGLPCEPQVAYLAPHDGSDTRELHVDALPGLPDVGEVPEWARGQRYEAIVSVAITHQRPENGGVVYGLARETVELSPGDVVLMEPEEPHAPTHNSTDEPRIAVYFRFTERRDDASLL